MSSLAAPPTLRPPAAASFSSTTSPKMHLLGSVRLRERGEPVSEFDKRRSGLALVLPISPSENAPRRERLLKAVELERRVIDPGESRSCAHG
jgi:hypothetical protein